MDQLVIDAVKVVTDTVFGATREYIGYIWSYDENLEKLYSNLNDLCNKKDGIDKVVLNGKDQLKEMTREAASWLKDVRLLTEDEVIKRLMRKDVETAKFVIKLMEEKALKRLLKRDSEMRDIVVKVVKRLQEDMVACGSEDSTRVFVEKDYKRVGGVVMEVMKDTTNEFKEFLKNNPKMVVIVTRMLKDTELEKLTAGDKEMEVIVADARIQSLNEDEEDEGEKEEDYENEALLAVPNVDGGRNEKDGGSIREKARKLVSSMGSNVLTPLGMKLMDDASFKKVVPEAESVMLGFEVIHGLLMNSKGLREELKEERKKQRRSCCGCFGVLIFHFHNRYEISKEAKAMATHINEIYSKVLSEYVVPIRTQDMKLPPSHFRQGMDSRDQLSQKIVEMLKGDQVGVIGVYGMGGTGKTTLAKEVRERVKDMFDTKVMVEVSETPDIGRIQQEIGEAIDLPLHDVQTVSQKATKLYHRLISGKEEKILIILDNIWTRLDLDEIGVPRRRCKLLLTTREKKVCRDMYVHDSEILEVGVLNMGEARYLFKAQAGKGIDDRGYNNVTERLLRKSGGLPLAIVATANALKDKDLSHWLKFATELEKPLSSQVGGEHRDAYTILDTSFRFLESDEKRMFFLLACLSPIGSSISIESLMRFGIGLELFRHVDTLSTAIEQANAWADELVSSSLLLEGDLEGHVKIHDLVRASAIAFVAKDGRTFLVEKVPRWMPEESFKKLTAMSLWSSLDYSRLGGVQADLLHILSLKGDLASKSLDSNFFQGMTNLKVLSLSNMNFKMGLPDSLREVKDLKTLLLHNCYLQDVSVIGELVNLLVLSFRGSTLGLGVQDEVGKLCKLRLLDMEGCKGKLHIPANVLSRLGHLEGLYMSDSFNDWEGNSCGEITSKNVSSTTELTQLPYLDVLEMHVPKLDQLQIDGQFVKKLSYSRIFVGEINETDTIIKVCHSHNVLKLNNVELSPGLRSNCMKELLKKANNLELLESSSFENLVPELDENGFKYLKHLTVNSCRDIKFCFNSNEDTDDLIAFVDLESLNLSNLFRLESICSGKLLTGFLSKLGSLKLTFLPNIKFVLAVDAESPMSLIDIVIDNCESLEFIFLNNYSKLCDGDNDSFGEERIGIDDVLPCLRSLDVSRTNVLSMFGPVKTLNSNGIVRSGHVFFNGKSMFPSLESLSLSSNSRIEKLWESSRTWGFPNLKVMTINSCNGLQSLGSPSLFNALVNLEELSVIFCSNMQEVISNDIEEDDESREHVIKFSKLKYLNLCALFKLDWFYKGSDKVEFPRLSKLVLTALPKMTNFIEPEKSIALSSVNKFEFPCLEELEVVNVAGLVDGPWKIDESNDNISSFTPVPKLKYLSVGNTKASNLIPHSMISENLSRLKVSRIQDKKILLSSSPPDEERTFTYSQLPKLEHLNVSECHSLQELVENEDDADTINFCGKFTVLLLGTNDKLNTIPLHLFKNLRQLYLTELNWEYAISGVLFNKGGAEQLPLLDTLEILYCNRMRAVIQDDSTSDDEVARIYVFGRLKILELAGLGIAHFCSRASAVLKFPSLESLIVRNCYLESFCSGSFIAPKLKLVELDDCENGNCFLPADVNNNDLVQQLPSLESLEINGCFDLKSFSSRPVAAPQLRNVTLIRCPRMERCLSGDTNNVSIHQEFPSLNTVSIESCPSLKCFSIVPIKEAPKLSHLKIDDHDYSKSANDELVSILNLIGKEQERLQSQGQTEYNGFSSFPHW